jgi:hypothetical protein
MSDCIMPLGQSWNSIPSSHTSMRARQRRALGRVLVEDRIGVVDVDQEAPGRRRQFAEPLDHSARTRLRQVADLAGQLGSDAQAGHFIVGPEGSVDHHCIGVRHGIERGRVDRAEARCIEQAPPAPDICDRDADVVARNRMVAVRRVRRRLARQRQRAKPQPGHARDFKALAVQRNALAGDAAVMRQHAQDGIALGQVLRDGVGAPQWQRRAALAQHEQAGRMIDLAVHQQHRGDCAVAQLPGRLQRWPGTDLLQHVGRGIEQHAVGTAIRPDEDRGLGAWLRPQRAGTQARAIAAIAVPLGKAAAGGRTQDRDSHAWIEN